MESDARYVCMIPNARHGVGGEEREVFALRCLDFAHFLLIAHYAHLNALWE